MSNKTKLELTWIGKDNRHKLEPRILLEDPEKSYHAAHRVTNQDIFDNRLIFGDNLLALKALEQEFTGKLSNRNSPVRSSASTLIRRTTLGVRLNIMTIVLSILFGFH